MPRLRLCFAAGAFVLLSGWAAPARAESLRDLRELVAAGNLADTAALCDRLAAAYDAGPPADAPAQPAQAAVSRFMACYCLYAKAQVLALQHQDGLARSALATARARRAADPSFANPRLQPIWAELDILTYGLMLEMTKQADAAVQAYLPATYGPISSTKATGRLALIELQRGHVDQARSWAFIHADDPTSSYVLAQLAVRSKNPAAAQRHLNTALGQIQKELTGGKEYMPVFFAEAPAIRALHRKLPPLPPPVRPSPPPATPPVPPAN